DPDPVASVAQRVGAVVRVAIPDHQDAVAVVPFCLAVSYRAGLTRPENADPAIPGSADVAEAPTIPLDEPTGHVAPRRVEVHDEQIGARGRRGDTSRRYAIRGGGVLQGHTASGQRERQCVDVVDHDALPDGSPEVPRAILHHPDDDVAVAVHVRRAVDGLLDGLAQVAPNGHVEALVAGEPPLFRIEDRLYRGLQAGDRRTMGIAVGRGDDDVAGQRRTVADDMNHAHRQLRV